MVVPPGETRLYYDSLKALAQSTFFDFPRSLCIASPMAIRFEANHLLDHIAYHHLLGADCFIFLVDQARSFPAPGDLLAKLRRRPMLIALVSPGKQEIQNVAMDVLALLRVMELPVEFFSYLDGDELLAVSPALPRDFPSLTPTHHGSPPSILPYLRHTLSGKNEVIYLHEWTYGSNGYAKLGAEQLAQQPEVGWLVQRSENFNPWYLPMHKQRDGSFTRTCVGSRRFWGKMIGRVHSEWRLQHMHAWKSGNVVLPDGREISHGGAQWPNAVPDPCAVQPLSFNHYLGPLSTCFDKASSGIGRDAGFLNQRLGHECRSKYFHDRGLNETVRDRIIARFAHAIRTHNHFLFDVRRALPPKENTTHHVTTPAVHSPKEDGRRPLLYRTALAACRRSGVCAPCYPDCSG